MANENADTPTPLTEVFSNGASESSSPASESTPAEKSASQDPSKTESSPIDGESGKTGDSSQAKGDEAKDKDSSEQQPSEKPAENADEKPADSSEKKDGEKPIDGKSKEVQPKEDPVLKQRFDETVKWGQQLSQQNTQMRDLLAQQAKQLEKLQKQVDGTWTEADEAAEHQGQTTEDVATRAVQVGKALASRANVLREYIAQHGGDQAKGTEAFNAALTEYQQLFANNEAIQQVVHNAESPVHEALHMVERYKFEQEFGSTPKQWRENMEKKLRPAIEKELHKTILEEIRSGKKAAASTPETLANKGAGDRADTRGLREEQPESIESLFPKF